MKLDINNEYHQLIIGACANLITEEGYTAREVLELLESSNSDLWDDLKKIEIEIGGTNLEFRAWDKENYTQLTWEELKSEKNLITNFKNETARKMIQMGDKEKVDVEYNFEEDTRKK